MTEEQHKPKLRETESLLHPSYTLPLPFDDARACIIQHLSSLCLCCYYAAGRRLKRPEQYMDGKRD